MNDYEVTVQWADGDTWKYHYQAYALAGAINQCTREFHDRDGFEIVSVEKK